MSETIKTPPLLTLSRHLREQAADPMEQALKHLVEDTATETERRELIEWALDDATRTRVLQMHEPLDEAERSTLAAAVVDNLKIIQHESQRQSDGWGRRKDYPSRPAHKSGIRRRWLLAAPAAGLAAAVSLWTMGEPPVQGMPRYRLEVLSARSSQRGPTSAAPDGLQPQGPAVDPSAGLSLVLRPEIDLPQADDLSVHVFLDGDNPLKPVQVDVQVAPGGAMRLEIPSLSCPERAHSCSLLLLVGQRDAVQEALLAPLAQGPAGRFQLLRLPLSSAASTTDFRRYR